MNYLLDSNVLLWWLEDSPRLGPTVRETLADPEDRILVSAASIWEIGIKQTLGKLRAPESVVDVLREEGFEELAMSGRHAEAAGRLPPLHRDPFDRMLIAQARLDNLTPAPTTYAVNWPGASSCSATYLGRTMTAPSRSCAPTRSSMPASRTSASSRTTRSSTPCFWNVPSGSRHWA